MSKGFTDTIKFRTIVKYVEQIISVYGCNNPLFNVMWNHFVKGYSGNWIHICPNFSRVRNSYTLIMVLLEIRHINLVFFTLIS